MVPNKGCTSIIHSTASLPERFAQELEAYYALWGWSKEGVPGKEALERLGMTL